MIWRKAIEFLKGIFGALFALLYVAVVYILCFAAAYGVPILAIILAYRVMIKIF